MPESPIDKSNAAPRAITQAGTVTIASSDEVAIRLNTYPSFDSGISLRGTSGAPAKIAFIDAVREADAEVE